MAKQEAPILQGQAPSAAELAWLKHAQDEQQKAPERIEEAAKYLAGIVSICLTIFMDKDPRSLISGLDIYLHAVSVLWMIAVVLSFFVLFPTRYPFTKDSPASIKAAFQQVAKTKRNYLKVAMGCFLFGLGLALFVFFS